MYMHLLQVEEGRLISLYCRQGRYRAVRVNWIHIQQHCILYKKNIIYKCTLIQNYTLLCINWTFFTGDSSSSSRGDLITSPVLQLDLVSLVTNCGFESLSFGMILASTLGLLAELDVYFVESKRLARRVFVVRVVLVWVVSVCDVEFWGLQSSTTTMGLSVLSATEEPPRKFCPEVSCKLVAAVFFSGTSVTGVSDLSMDASLLTREVFGCSLDSALTVFFFRGRLSCSLLIDFVLFCDFTVVLPFFIPGGGLLNGTLGFCTLTFGMILVSFSPSQSSKSNTWVLRLAVAFGAAGFLVYFFVGFDL